jgi:glycosyltransferase involved in cell wall biosynthesis
MIVKPYVLFTRISLIKNQKGRVFCDPLWEKDLKLHLEYIENFGICCPIEYRENIEGLKDITDLGIKWIFELKKDYGLKSVLLNFLPNLFTVKNALKKAKIAHSGGAGWAFPLSFYLLFLRPFFSFRWIIVIESSFWMLEQGDKRTIRRIIEHYVHKALLTKCVSAADARIFTQSFYRKYFLGDKEERTWINPATWIDRNIITTSKIVRDRFKERGDNTLKIIFPSRLVEDKGVFIVLDAIEKLKKTTQCIHVTIMGSGDLEQDCQRFINAYSGNVDVVFKNPVAYGNEFFKILTHYDFVLVPNLKQEQPRVIFDAFSQGVPVIGSDTSGIMDITNIGNAVTFKRGDSSSLAKVISSINRNHAVLDMGLAGLDYVAGKTHLQMHKDRAEFLNDIL